MEREDEEPRSSGHLIPAALLFGHSRPLFLFPEAQLKMAYWGLVQSCMVCLRGFELNELSSFDYANDQAAAVTVTEQIPTADDIMTLSRQQTGFMGCACGE
jgi:hypothetical protein